MAEVKDIYTVTISEKDWNLLENYKSSNEKAIEYASQVFREIAPIFYDCAKQLTRNQEYISRLTVIIEFIQKHYNIPWDFVCVDPTKYTIPEWGGVYWKFMHSASILYELANKSSTDLKEDFFPYIVYNIDFVIPCGNCKAHYAQVKRTEEIETIVKQMAFGNYISGVFKFHNAITENINNLTKSKRSLFSPLEFAQQWFVFVAFTDPSILTKFNTLPVLSADKITFYKAIILSQTTKTPWAMHLGKSYRPDKFPVTLELSNKVVADALKNIEEDIKTPYPILF